MAKIVIETKDAGRIFTVGGGDEITGTTGVDHINVDASANGVIVNAGAGNDVITVAGNVGTYTVAQDGTSLVLTNATGGKTYIPLTDVADTLNFGDATAAIVIDTTAGTLKIGTQTVTATPVAITGAVPIIPTFAIAAAAATAEGATADFTISMINRAPGTAYTVTPTLAGAGGATAGTDFAATLTLSPASIAAGYNYTGGVLTIPASITGTTASAVLQSLVATDAISPETGEAMTVTLTAPTGTGAVIGTAAATTAITDVPRVVPYAITAASTSVNEGASIAFNVVTEAAEAGKTIAYTITGGTGFTSADITGGKLTGTTTVGADGKATINVTTYADAITEGAETMTVTLDGKAVSASTTIVDTSMGPEASFYLTKGQDIATANKFFASQTYFSVDGVGPTLNTGDYLTGMAGKSDNTLTVTDLTPLAASGNIPAGVTLTNIQNVVLNSSNNTAAGTGFSTVGFADVRKLDVSTNGDNSDIVSAANGASGAAVTVQHNGYNVGGNLNVVGGNAVTASTTGGNVIVGSPAGLAANRISLGSEVATGAVVVNQNGSGAGGAAVQGGTTVTVNVTSTSNTGTVDIGNTPNNTADTPAGAIANPSGNITLNQSGVGAAVVFGGANVKVVNTALGGTNTSGAGKSGAITVGDATAVDVKNQPSGTVTVTETNLTAYDGQTTAGVAHNNFVSGAIGVYGGTDVTVTSNGGGTVTVGAATVTGAKASGTVTVTTTGISNATAAGAISVSGGTDVTVTTAGAAVTIGQTNNAKGTVADNPTGKITVVETIGRGVSPITAQTNTITTDGGTSVNITAKGQVVSVGGLTAPTGAITIDQADVLTGRGYGSSKNASTVTANGGTSVTVNTSGGAVTVGAANPNILPTGAVIIKDTFSGAGNDAFSVLGGTTVGITSTYSAGAVTVGNANAIVLDSTGATLKNAVLAPTGNVTISNVTSGNSIDGKGTATNYFGAGPTNVYTNGADTVSVIGGATALVSDIQSTLATGGAGSGKAVGTSKLANVTLSGFQTGGAIAVNSDALANLTVLNNTVSAANAITVTNNTASHALTITQGNNTKALTITDAKATTVTVTDTASALASSGALTLNAVKATALTVNNAATASLILTNDTELTSITLKGAGTATLTGAEALSKIATFDASASTGAVTVSGTTTAGGFAPTSTASVSQKFTGGSGVTKLTVSSNAISWGDGVLLTGGSGSSDVLVANYAAGATDVAMGSGTASVKGFEFLGLGNLASSAAASYDAAGFSGVTLGVVAADVTFTNAAKNASLSITADPAKNVGFTGVSSATIGVADALTINLGTSSTTGLNTVGKTLTANGYEALTINSTVKSTSTGVNTMTLVDTPTGGGSPTLTVTGAGALTLTDATTRFTALTSSNTKTVDLDLVVASNKGVAITGGAGALKATGATGGTEVVKIALDGTGTKVFTVNDTWVVTLGGSTFTYTAAAADTATLATTYMAAAITAGATTGPVALVGGNPAVTASASGATLLLSKAAATQAYAGLTFTAGANAVSSTSSALEGGSEEQYITISLSGTNPIAANETSVATINGNAATFTAAGGETVAQVATGLAAAINALAATSKIGVTSAVASGANIIITGGATGVFSSTSGTTAGATITTVKSATAINYATANDSFTTGAGAGTFTAGLGGSWSNTTHRYSSGSESVNLAASVAVVDTLKLADGRVVTNNGTLGGVTGFTVGSLSASDALSFTTVGKTAIANVTVPAAVSALTGAATMANVLDPSGALLTALANLTYTVSNGVITFSATGGHSLSEFTKAQLVSAAEMLVNSATTGGANKAALFSTNGITFAVASDAGNLLAAGSNSLDSLVELAGVSSTTGFGSTGAQGTIVSAITSVTYLPSNTVNTGSATVAVYDQTGFSADTIVAAEFGTVSTSIANLKPSAYLTLTGAGGGTYEALSTTQTGTAGLNSLTLKTTGAADIYKAITVTGDGLLVLNPTGATTINSLIDGGSTHTLTNINVIAGGAALGIKAITDTALTTVDTTAATALVTLGSTTPLAQNSVTFKMASGFDSTISTSGSSNIFTSDATVPAGGAGILTIVATGAANTFNLTSTSAGNVITANGAGDTFNIGNTAATGGYAITATGSGNIVTFSATHNTATTVDTGTNAVITFGVGNEKIFVGGDATGGTSASYAFDTLKNVDLGTAKSLDFTVAGIADGNTSALGGLGGAGQTLANAQINVSTAATLAAALDLAANISSLTRTPGTDLATAVFAGGYVYGNGILGATSAVIDWFQYAGDTYIVEAVNTTATVAQQTALDSNDVVIKISGLVDLSTSTYSNVTGLLTFV